MHDDRFAAGRRLGVYPVFATIRKYQQASFRACLFNRRTHDHLDQLFKDDVPRDRLRHLDHSGEIQVFDLRRNCARRARRELFRSKVRIHLLELPHLPVGSPTQVAVPSVLQICLGDDLEFACRVESRGEFVGKRLDVHKAVCACRADGQLVKTHRIKFTPFDPGNLCAH
ncbi:hypothetical protein D3C85_1245470 [compost metagenome]